MKVSHIFRFFRFYDWYYDVLILAIMALLLKPGWKLSYFLLFVICLYMYGFLTNSYADRESDRIAGKKTYIYLFPKQVVLILAAIFAVLPILISSVLGQVVLGALIVLLATFYSLKPIRLKEKGIFGFIILVLIILPLPYLLFVLSLGRSLVSSLPMLSWLFLLSFTNALAHHYSDISADKRSSVSTWAVQLGKEKARLIYAWSIGLTAFFPIVLLLLDGVAGIETLILCEVLLVYPLEEFFNSA